MTRSIPKPVIEFILSQARSDLYGAYCRNRLMELLERTAAGTAPPAPVQSVTGLIENEVRQILGDGAVIEHPPIRRGADSAECENVIVRLGGSRAGERGLLFIVDPGTAAPASRPRSTADRVFGCGAAGCKAQTAMALAQMKLLTEVKDRFGFGPGTAVMFQFPADGAAGEAGISFAAADADAGGWEAVILNTTGGVPHTGQPGVVPFTCRLGGARPLDLFPFVVQAIEAEGARLRNECRNGTGSPEAWSAATQTNHGVLGAYGLDPATACERVSVRVRLVANANPERIAMRMTEVIDATLAEYFRHRTDLTKQVEPATGEPKLKRHYALSLEPAADALAYRIDVFGRRARVGTPLEADSAISKAAFMFASLMQIQRNFPNVRAEAALADGPQGGAGDELIIRGVQTFGRPHDAAAVRQRLTAAAGAGAAQCRQIRGEQNGGGTVAVEFGGPDREPFEPAGSSGTMEAFRSAFEAASLTPPTGSVWPGVSCGDYISAAGRPVVLFGAGRLDRAGTEHECVEIPDIQQGLTIATLATLGYAAAGS